MKSEITEIRKVHSGCDQGNIRVWSNGQRISRADAAVIPLLDGETVDAVFEQSALNFDGEVESISDRTIEHLTAQLSVLEAQCEKLREMLQNVR